MAEKRAKKILLMAFLLPPAPMAFSAAGAGAGLRAGQAPPSLAEPLESRQRLISMTIITEKDIKKCPGCDLADILERAGAQVRRHHRDFSESSDSDTAYIALRGGSDAHTALFVDGIIQKDAMLSEPVYPFNNIHHIKRIEIIRGPSAMHGSPVGGVIHIITKKAECPPERSACLDAAAELSNESNTGKTGYTSSHIRSDSGRSGIRLGVQGDHSEDPEKTGSYREKALTLNFDHRSESGSWLSEGSAVMHDSRGSGRPQLTIPKGGSGIISLGNTFYVSPALLFKLITGYNRETQSYTDDFTKYTSRRLVIKALGQYSFDFKDGSYELTAGLERQEERIGSQPENSRETGEPNYPMKKRNISAAFALLDGSQGPFVYQAAARTDDLSGDIHEGVWTWSGAASWHAAKISGKDIFLRVGAGTGFRAPGFDEKYLYFDPDLELEKSKTYELGMRLENESLFFFDAAFFETDLKNTVRYGEETQPKDGGKISGLEAQAGASAGKLSGTAQYTYTDSEDMSLVRGHNPVRHLASLSADYPAGAKWIFGANLTHRGKRETAFRGEGVNLGDNVNLIDLRSSYEISRKIRLGIAVRNLMDERYYLGPSTTGPRRTLWLTFEAVNF